MSNEKKMMAEMYGLPYKGNSSSTLLLIKKWRKKRLKRLKRLKSKKNERKDG